MERGLLTNATAAGTAAGTLVARLERFNSERMPAIVASIEREHGAPSHMSRKEAALRRRHARLTGIRLGQALERTYGRNGSAGLLAMLHGLATEHDALQHALVRRGTLGPPPPGAFTLAVRRAASQLPHTRGLESWPQPPVQLQADRGRRSDMTMSCRRHLEDSREANGTVLPSRSSRSGLTMMTPGGGARSDGGDGTGGGGGGGGGVPGGGASGRPSATQQAAINNQNAREGKGLWGKLGNLCFKGLPETGAAYNAMAAQRATKAKDFEQAEVRTAVPEHLSRCRSPCCRPIEPRRAEALGCPGPVVRCRRPHGSPARRPLQHPPP